jgi:predicted component of type VI protein secretion system
MVIQILFRDPRSGSEKKYEFDQSPIRIGRNPLNNVVLEGNFVSGWHGIIRFDNTGTFYFDLGSTNGTCLDGKRLQKNTPIPITKPTRLTIWMFEIVVTPGAPNVMAAPQYQPPMPGIQSPPGRTTEVFQVGSISSSQHPSSSMGPPSRIVSVGARAPTPPPPSSLPVRSPSQAISPRPSAEQQGDRLVRCLRIIGAFSEAFMGLKKGYEQFGSEVGVRPLSGTTPLHRARTSQEIIDYLMDPSIDPEACARDLNSVFADMGLHDVALVQGVFQGVRGLLANKLDPNTLDFKSGAGLWSGSKAKTRWSSYIESFNNLLVDDAILHSEIFGEEFASGYASVALGNENANKDDG